MADEESLYDPSKSLIKERVGRLTRDAACSQETQDQEVGEGPVESAIVPWYWFGADINTGAADEDDLNLLKV